MAWEESGVNQKCTKIRPRSLGETLRKREANGGVTLVRLVPLKAVLIRWKVKGLC